MKIQSIKKAAVSVAVAAMVSMFCGAAFADCTGTGDCGPSVSESTTKGFATQTEKTPSVKLENKQNPDEDTTDPPQPDVKGFGSTAMCACGGPHRGSVCESGETGHNCTCPSGGGICR